MIKLLKKGLAAFLVAVLVITMIPAAAFADTGTTMGDFTVTGGSSGTDYSYTNGNGSTSGVLTVKTSTAITIKNTSNSGATADRIEVAVTSGAADITLAGVNINISAPDSTAMKIVKETGDVKITLKGTNKLKSGNNCAGLQKESASDKKLTITGGSDADSLTATSNNYGAGIGGGLRGEGSNININGGKVEAIGGNRGAGIGGGEEGKGSGITISGGTVTATGGYYGAEIGGGDGGTGSNITIKGGTVTASGYVGIGSGNNGTDASEINIDPSDGKKIAVKADDTLLEGSPFSKTTDITTLIVNAKKLESEISEGGGGGGGSSPGQETLITLNKTLLRIYLGGTSYLNAVATNTPYNTIKWSSSNPKIARVDNYGNIKGLSRGTAYITASLKDGKSASCKVKVSFDTPTLTGKSIGNKTNILKWNKIKMADGYKVYRATSKDGKYKLVKTSLTTSWKDTKRTPGKTYYYKSRAYSKKTKVTTFSDYSKIVKLKTEKINK